MCSVQCGHSQPSRNPRYGPVDHVEPGVIEQRTKPSGSFCTVRYHSEKTKSASDDGSTCSIASVADRRTSKHVCRPLLDVHRLKDYRRPWQKQNEHPSCSAEKQRCSRKQSPSESYRLYERSKIQTNCVLNNTP